MNAPQLKKNIAHAVSFILHPALVPLLFSALVFSEAVPPYSRSVVIYLLVAIFVGTCVIPGILAILLYKMGVISSLFMHRREDRRVPYLTGAVFYYFTAIAVRWVSSAHLIYLFLIGICVVILVLLMQIPFYKASAHLAAYSGFFAAMLVLSRLYGWSHWYLIVLILSIGLVAWARLEINAHTTREVIGGFISGFVPLFVLFSLLIR